MDSFWHGLSMFLVGLISGVLLFAYAAVKVDERTVKSGVLIHENKAYCVTLMGGYE